MGSDQGFVERASCPHNEDFECADCAAERHGLEHPELVEGCRVCKFSSLQFTPSCFPTRPRRVNPLRRVSSPWEQGIVKDHRGVPLVKGDGQLVGVKEYGENRRAIESTRRRNAQTTTTTQE